MGRIKKNFHAIRLRMEDIKIDREGFHIDIKINDENIKALKKVIKFINKDLKKVEKAKYTREDLSF